MLVSPLSSVSSHTLAVQSEAIPQHLGHPALEPVRLSGDEGLSDLFSYELLLKTPDSLNLLASHAANWDLDGFIGREISCTIALDGQGQFIPGAVGSSADHIGQGERQINALITDAQLWGQEGRHVQYKLTLRPWLHLATLSTDCKIFQNQSVVDTLDELLADYPFPVDKRLLETYAVRDYQVQYNETDHQFLERLCQENGISYFFEHSQGKHRLVLIDNMGAYRKNDSAAYQHVEYHPPGWKLDAEYINSFVPQHQLTSGRYATSDYDYTRPRANLTASRSAPRPTGQSTSEVYQWHSNATGSHYAQPQAGAAPANDPQAEGRNFALLRMQALRSHGARAQASGNLRGMVPGCSFTLQKHPQQKANTEYLILKTHFLIEDTGQASQIKGASPNRKQQWRVEVNFTAHPMTEILRPAMSRAKPHTGGPQVALVVGPTAEGSATGAGQNLWTDALGRIKVQFPWDRIGQKSQHSSCWIRVSSPWAGNQLGAMHIPRIGQEVIIDFIGGDADLPICTGRLNNQNNLPPWALPSQSALSGFRSRELSPEGGNSAVGRSNHLILDDTSGGLQAQLKSDHQHSQLSLGHITRIEGNAGRQDARGQGFELRTDGHGVVRAADGLLLTTEARPHAAGHAKAMQETVARLEAAQAQHDGLSDAALQAQAHAAGDQDEVARALKVQNDAIRGAGLPGGAEPGGFAELAAPHLMLASPAGIESTSAQSTHLQAGEHMALTTGLHASVSAGASFLASARQAIRLFAYKAGMRLVAHGGDIEIKALRNSINIFANLSITQTAETIDICARKKLTLSGGGSGFALDASGIVGLTQGVHRVFAAMHSHMGPMNAPTRTESASSSLKDLAKDPDNRVIVLRSHPEDGHPAALEPYTLYRNGAEVEKGVTDRDGQLFIKDHDAATGSYQVKLSNGNEYQLPVFATLHKTDQRLAAQGFRAPQDEPQQRLKHFQHTRHTDNGGQA